MEKLPLIGLIIISVIGLAVFGSLAMGEDIGTIGWGGGNGMMGGGNRMMGGGGCSVMNDNDSNFMNYMHEECEEHMEEHCGDMSWEECEEMHEECEEHMPDYCDHDDKRIES